MKPVKLTKYQKNDVTWLQTLADRDRDALTGIRATKGGMMAADGFVLGYVADKPDEMGANVSYMLSKPVKHDGEFVVMAEELQNQNWPDLSESSLISGEHDVEIVITPEILIRALKGFGDNACIRIHPSRKSLTISDEFRFALVALRLPGDKTRNDVSLEDVLKG